MFIAVSHGLFPSCIRHHFHNKSSQLTQIPLDKITHASVTYKRPCELLACDKKMANSLMSKNPRAPKGTEIFIEINQIEIFKQWIPMLSHVHR
jgi:hypothetical protein